MISAGFYMSRIAKSFPDNPLWQFLGHQTDHADWRGYPLGPDSTLFHVHGGGGAAVLGGESPVGERSFVRLFLHALWRSLALVFLGVFLSSSGQRQTDFNYVIVLSQIGLGYRILWAIGLEENQDTNRGRSLECCCSPGRSSRSIHCPVRDLITSPLGPADWAHFQGFEAHWDKNANAFSAFDRWFMNIFPREKKFEFNNGGYATLKFNPIARDHDLWLAGGGPFAERPFEWREAEMDAGGGSGRPASGRRARLARICPMVKRIWTPSFAIYSSGGVPASCSALFSG